MQTFILLLTLLLTSCASNDFYEKEFDYRNKSNANKLHAGATCSNGCIWSTFAVSNQLQQASMQCQEGPCACVVQGNAGSLCEAKSLNESIIAEEPVPMTISGIKDIPYFNQYYNEFYGHATCQNTSIAMVLSYYEKSYYLENIHPDTIYRSWGRSYAQSPSGLNAVYSSYAQNSQIITYTNATPEQLIKALEAGYVAIVHGYFTGYGHVLVVRGYENERYYVNDPAGRWAECFKCGYNSINDLGGVTSYSKESFEAAVFTSDGYNFLPGWVHLISPL